MLGDHVDYPYPEYLGYPDYPVTAAIFARDAGLKPGYESGAKAHALQGASHDAHLLLSIKVQMVFK